MNKTVISFMLLVLLFCCLIIPANATEEKVHTIESADFRVVLNTDGSADVVETWEVTFVSGEFSRFKKEIYMDVSDREKFTDVTNISVTIDGKECSESETDGYSVARTDNKCILYANKKSENVSHTYTFSYTLTDVVKQLDEDSSYFSYRFVGAHHPVTIKNLTVTISMPVDGTFDTEHVTRGTSKIQGKSIRYAANYSEGLYKVSLRYDTEQPFGVPYASAASELGTDIQLGVLLVIFVGFPLACVIKAYMRAYDAHLAQEERIKAGRKYVADHPDEFVPLLEKLDTYYTPSQIAAILLAEQGRPKILAVIIAELIQSGHILLTEDKEHMILKADLPDPEFAHQKECLALLGAAGKKCMNIGKHDPEPPKIIVPIEDVVSLLSKKPHKYEEKFRSIRTALTVPYLVKDHPEEQAIREAGSKAWYYLDSWKFNKVTWTDLRNTAENGKLTAMMALAYMYTNHSDAEISAEDRIFVPLVNAREVWSHAMGSSSDGSGCSSCGGCGGCSGCGSCGGE